MNPITLFKRLLHHLLDLLILKKYKKNSSTTLEATGGTLRLEGVELVSTNVYSNNKIEFEENMSNILTTEQRAKLVVTPRTATGMEAPIDGPIEFTTSDPAVVVIQDIPGGPYAAGVLPGTATLTATFDADLDEGELRTVTLTAEVTVVQAEAVGGTMELNEIEFIPGSSTNVGH